MTQPNRIRILPPELASRIAAQNDNFLLPLDQQEEITLKTLGKEHLPSRS